MTERIPMKVRMLTLVFVALFGAVPALAADPSIGQTAFAVPDSKTAQKIFTTDTPKIVLHVQLVDVPAKTTVGAAWIAEKTGGAPPDYEIDSAEITTSG